MKIGDQIKKYRKNAGLTQEQVGNYLGVTPPAVNKWEKGNTYPDISLLPALARLLKIDMNELFSFREELTEYEIAQFTNELSEKALRGEAAEAFDMAEKKILEYPHCGSLLCAVAGVLNGALSLAVLDKEQREAYENKILDWLERSADSEDDGVRISAAYMLALKYTQRKDFDRANQYMDKIPDINVDKAMIQVGLLTEQDDLDAAAVFLEGKILQALVRVQSYLYKIIELKEQTGNHRKADEIAAKAGQMVTLFDMWQYGAVVPQLILAVFRKDTDQSIKLLKSVLEEAQKPWRMDSSALYYRYPAKESAEGIGQSYINAILREIENQEEYEFLRGNAEFERVLEKYKKQL